ncbi:MAG: redoxin domain-containing protein [Fimbriimonadaceae bacterium]|nr:redoxin domain-containing protein [Fimbriimonadaceae bacterium]
MKTTGLLVLSVALAAGCAAPPKLAPIVEGSSKPRHPVTATMAEEAEANARKPAPPFDGVDAAGRERTLESLTHGRPLVLYFVKDGCPCSVDAEPLYQRMAAKFGAKANFAAVINGGQVVADKWLKVMKTPYPVILDPDMKVIKDYGIERSVYLALIDAQRRIVKLWPGYSASMLKELNAALSKATDTEETPFDPLYAPVELSSGCSFASSVPGV